MNFSAQKIWINMKHAIDFDVNGGDSISETTKTYTLGNKYGSFPIATKTGETFVGWYTEPLLGIQVNADDEVDFSIHTLYAHYEWLTNFTSFKVVTTTEHKKFGIWYADLKPSSSSVFVDWGDGTVEEIEGDIFSLTHEYLTVGIFIVKVSDDISSIAISFNNSAEWSETTSLVKYTLQSILHCSTNVTSFSTSRQIIAHGFTYCLNLTSILGIIESNVSALPSYCFKLCTKLSTLDGLLNITKIDNHCFDSCKSISDFTSLGNITAIPYYAFYDCTLISSLDTLPTSVSAYGSGCFSNTKISNLSRIRTTDTLNSACFSDMNSLTSIETLLPRNTLPPFCFYSCNELLNVDFSSWNLLSAIPLSCFEKNKKLTNVVFNTNLKYIDTTAFSQCAAINNINLKDTLIHTVGYEAFNMNYSLTSISLPSTLSAIDSRCLENCLDLQQISCYALTAPVLGSECFGKSTLYLTSYTGYHYRSSGNNTLYIQHNAVGYDTGLWNDPLLNIERCGFHITTIIDDSTEK